MGMKKLPSNDRLLALYDYNPETGVVTDKRTSKRAGSVTPTGYRRMRIDGEYYREHRIIYKMMTCVDPGDYEIDHINRDRSDNRWSNLRICTHGQNQVNAPATGIYYDKRRKTWSVKLRVQGKLKHMSTHTCPLLARLDYERVARDIHGEFYCA